MVGESSTLWHTCRPLVCPKPCRYDVLSLGVGTTLSELAASDEIGGLLSRSDSLEKVLLGLYRSEPLTRGEARLLNVTRWESVSLLVVDLKNCRIVRSDHNLVALEHWGPVSQGKRNITALSSKQLMRSLRLYGSRHPISGNPP